MVNRSRQVPLFQLPNFDKYIRKRTHCQIRCHLHRDGLDDDRFKFVSDAYHVPQSCCLSNLGDTYRIGGFQKVSWPQILSCFWSSFDHQLRIHPGGVSLRTVTCAEQFYLIITGLTFLVTRKMLLSGPNQTKGEF